MKQFYFYLFLPKYFATFMEWCEMQRGYVMAVRWTVVKYFYFEKNKKIILPCLDAQYHVVAALDCLYIFLVLSMFD